MSVLVAGKDVFSFVPKGGSLQVPLQNDIVLVRVEPDGIPLKTIQTDNVVNSCASSSRTGQTVCTSTEKDVYVFTGPILTSKLNSSGSGKSVFSVPFARIAGLRWTLSMTEPSSASASDWSRGTSMWISVPAPGLKKHSLRKHQATQEGRFRRAF